MNKIQNIPEDQRSQEIMQKIILAFLGMTKAGKTTAIAALTGYPENIIEISTGDYGRTKLTVEYHFVTDVSNEIIIENVEFFMQSIMMSADGTSKDKFNEEIEKNMILRDILKLKKIPEGEKLQDSVSRQLKELNKGLKQDDIKKLITTEGIDKYIKKLILRVEANEELKNFICNKKIDLYVRDTRGLMDIALEEVGGEKKLSNVRPLSELGFDGINGAIYFCSDSYPNIVSSIYEDTFKNVFQSVPFFLLAKDHGMIKVFRSNNQPETMENVSAMIQGIQDGSNKNYTDVETEYFLETLALLEKFKVTEFNANCEYQFKDQYFKQRETEFLSSICNSIKKAGLTKNITNIGHDTDFKFYQLTVTASIERMVSMIYDLHKSINTVIQSGIASGILQQNYNSFINELQNDLEKYNNRHTSNGATAIIKPQLTTMSRSDLEKILTDNSYDILGKYGGITTMNNGKLRYAATAVISVTGLKSLYRLIEKIKLTSDLTDGNGNALMPNLLGDYGKQEALLKKALNYILFHSFTDQNASVQYYMIVDRYKVKHAIENIRVNGISPANSVTESTKNIIDSFCNFLERINDISSMFMKK
jgi:hypothetical protein